MRSSSGLADYKSQPKEYSVNTFSNELWSHLSTWTCFSGLFSFSFLYRSCALLIYMPEITGNTMQPENSLCIYYYQCLSFQKKLCVQSFAPLLSLKLLSRATFHHFLALHYVWDFKHWILLEDTYSDCTILRDVLVTLDVLFVVLSFFCSDSLEMAWSSPERSLKFSSSYCVFCH